MFLKMPRNFTYRNYFSFNRDERCRLLLSFLIKQKFMFKEDIYLKCVFRFFLLLTETVVVPRHIKNIKTKNTTIII